MWTGLPAIVLALAMQSDPVTVSATLDADKLEVGREYSITVTVGVVDGFTTTRTGGPGPILQIMTPAAAELFGKVLTSAADRSYKGYLYEPHARLIGPGASTIRFTLKSAPGEGDSFSLNVVGYVAARDSEDVRIFRKRLELPLKPGAAATPADAIPSDWGDEPIVKLGEKAPPFTLPRQYQTPVTLADYAGKPVVVTTYRSFFSLPCQQHLRALHEIYPEFQRRGVTVLAIAKEDADIETHGNIRKGLPEEKLHFLTAADPPESPQWPHASQTDRYERVTTYLIDKDGVVRQIFPGTIEKRAPWRAVLSEIDALEAQPR